MNPRPLRDQLLVRSAPEPKREESAIRIVRTENPPSGYADVMACGPDVVDERLRTQPRVLISRLQGIAIGDDTLLIPEGAVLAFVEGERGDTCSSCGLPFALCTAREIEPCGTARSHGRCHGTMYCMGNGNMSCEACGETRPLPYKSNDPQHN